MIRELADIEEIERIPLEQQNDVWTVPDLLKRGAALDPGKAALLYLKDGSPNENPEIVTYQQLTERVAQAVNLFHSLGVGANDSVAILMPTVPQNYVAMFAAATAGIAFPINWMLHPSQIGELMEAARSKVLVTLGPTPDYDIWGKAETLRQRFGKSLHILQVPGPGGRVDLQHNFDLRASRTKAADPARTISADDTAFYIHTGGTTNKPKLARIPHRCIAYKSWAMALLTRQEPSQTVFGVSPLFHIGGIVLKTITSLSRGQTTLIPGAGGFRNKNVIRDYWKLIERFRITDLAGVPTVLGALTSVPVNGADISSLRPLATSGSSALPTAIADHFEKTLGIRILSDYGLTEATASVTLPPRDGPRKDGSSGIRLPFTQVRTVMIDGGCITRDCAVNEIGEIIVKGPGVIPGYVDPALDAGLFLEDRWIRTGDLGRLDEDGYLWVTGRAKDLIIRSGHNIDPRIIEDTLMTHDGVALVAAVGKPDAFAGELPVAYVQPKPGAALDAERLKEFARAKISERAAAPVDVFLIDALPVTGVGKIYKQELRERALCLTISKVVSSLVPPGMFGSVVTTPDPASGMLVTVTLLRGRDNVDQAVEEKVRVELGRYAFASTIAWYASDLAEAR